MSINYLGSSSLIHIDAGCTVGGPTYFWHLVLLTLPTAATTVMLAPILYAELPF